MIIQKALIYRMGFDFEYIIDLQFNRRKVTKHVTRRAYNNDVARHVWPVMRRAQGLDMVRLGVGHFPGELQLLSAQLACVFM